MKRKIIISESQYNKLQEFLFETADVNDTLDYVNTNDVLLFKGPYNVKINVVNVDQNTGEILGTTDKDEKVKFFFNSYDENTKKFNFQKLDKTTNKYVNQPFDVKELDILRNGKVLPIRDANRKTPEPVAKPDDISKPVEMDPNVTSTPETPEETEKVKKQRMYGKKALKAITSDPQLQAAFYRQPSFWKLFMADMQGKTAPGKGIQPTLELINGYMDRKNKQNNPDLASFKMQKNADLTISKPISFTVKSKILGGKDETYTIPANTPGDKYTAFNRPSNWFDATTNTSQNSTMLEYLDKDNKLNFKFKIMVKPPAISADTFKCDIVYGSDIVAKDVLITFLNSDGYNKN